MMKNVIIILFLLSINLYSCGKGFQDISSISKNDSCEYYHDDILQENVYTVVDLYPSYLGGDSALANLVYGNLKHFSIDDDQLISHSKVLLSIIVGKDDKAISFGIKGKEPENYTSLDKKIIEIMNLAKDKWISGQCRGEKVITQTFYPMRFRFR